MVCKSIGDVLRSLEAFCEAAGQPPQAILKRNNLTVEGRKPKTSIIGHDVRFEKSERPSIFKKMEADLGVSDNASPGVACGLPPVSPWLDPAMIRPSVAKDVLARLERGMDDRSYAQKSALGSHFVAIVRAVHKAKRMVKAKPAPKPKVQKERTPELKEYYRNYGRVWRARKRAGAALRPEPISPPPSPIPQQPADEASEEHDGHSADERPAAAGQRPYRYERDDEDQAAGEPRAEPDPEQKEGRGANAELRFAFAGHGRQ